jgi:hypothetical protein
MSDVKTSKSEPTAVDDVRRVREKIAQEHGGDIRKHIEETNRIGEELRAKLKVHLSGIAASRGVPFSPAR